MPERRTIFLEDENGFPQLVAAVETPPSPPERKIPDLITPDHTSGPAEWGRYHDAVREASRSFDHPEEGDVHHFLRARARNPEQVDAAAFHEAVRRQRLADIVDIVDHHMRRDGHLPRGARMIRVQAPRGYMRRALRQMTPEDLAHLHHRLVSIGHNHEHVSKYLSDRVKPDVWEQATKSDVMLSADEVIIGEFEGLNFDDSEGGYDETVELADVMGAVIEKMPAPIINVTIEQKPMKTVPVRDEKGIISYTVQEPIDES
jgi:hypothetical protein